MGCSVATLQSCWVSRSATQQPSNSVFSRRVGERRAAGCGEECAAIGVRLLAQPSLHRFDGGLRTALTRHFLPDEAKIATLELAGCPMLLSGCPNTTGPAKSGAVLFFKRRVVYLPFCACHRFTQPSLPPQNRSQKPRIPCVSRIGGRSFSSFPERAYSTPLSSAWSRPRSRAPRSIWLL